MITIKDGAYTNVMAKNVCYVNFIYKHAHPSRQLTIKNGKLDVILYVIASTIFSLFMLRKFIIFLYDYDHQSVLSHSRLFLNNVFYTFLKQAKDDIFTIFTPQFIQFSFLRP